MTTDDDLINGYDGDTWITIILNINQEVRRFKKHLQDRNISVNTTYMNEWNELYAAICDEHLENPEITYEETTKYMFGDPTTIADYANEALNIVPPIRMTTIVKRVTGKRGAITIEFQDSNTYFTDEQVEMHQTLKELEKQPTTPDRMSKVSDISSGIDPEFKAQIKALEDQLNTASENLEPRLNQIKNELPNTIAQAVQNSFDKMLGGSNSMIEKLQEKINSAQTQSDTLGSKINESMKNVQRASEKITGDLKNANEKLEQIQSKARIITNQTTESSDRAIKEYMTAKVDLQSSVFKATETIMDKEDESWIKWTSTYKSYRRQKRQLQVKLQTYIVTRNIKNHFQTNIRLMGY